jgi:hypothetical protein
MLGLAAAGVAFAIFAPGQRNGADEFATAPETALQRLEARHRIVNGSGLGSLTIEGRSRHEGTVGVVVQRAGSQHWIDCQVAITSLSSGGSSAITECAQAAPGPTAKLAIQALNIVMKEHVAATIEDREYDIDGVADKMLAFMTSAGPTLAAADEFDTKQ